MTSAVSTLQDRYLSAIDHELDGILSSLGDPTHPFYIMMRYHLGYSDAAGVPLRVPAGKRIRPALCLLACEAVTGTWRPALHAAAAIELLHNFSLIHDDIEDDDPSRHHRPTVWKVWGRPHGINVGDGMFALAASTMLKASSNANTAVEILAEFQQTALRLTEGQFFDMAFESQTCVTVQEYLEMISRKTAVLIGFSLWSGIRIGGGRESTARRLHAFGRHLGTAFQIRDDIQGIWATENETGKVRGGDLHNRKKTLPVLLAMENGSPAQQARMGEFFRGGEVSLEEVLMILEQTDARQTSQVQVNSYRQQALEVLSTTGLAQEHEQLLQRVTEELTA